MRLHLKDLIIFLLKSNDENICVDGLGFCANSLELGCDCVGNIQYFDAVMNNSKGNPHYSCTA